MQGKIVKGIAGFYYVCDGRGITFECKAKGIFRKENKKPLVGDDVEFELLDETEATGNIVRILPRKNALKRPAVANVDQAVIILASKNPLPDFNLLDRYLILMRKQQVSCLICFNKMDLVDEEKVMELQNAYQNTGYRVLSVSAKTNQGMEAVYAALQSKTTVLAGPSGVGKSSLINRLLPDAQMETGGLSKKISRGKHTTRHSQLFCFNPDTYIMDTPGFSSLDVSDITHEELKEYFPEFEPLEGACRFLGCAHYKEPDCRVKEAVEQGIISRARYHSYLQLYAELKAVRRY